MENLKPVLDKQYDLFKRIAKSWENTKKLGKDRLNRHTLELRVQSIESSWEAFRSNHDKLSDARTEEMSELAYFTDDLYSDCEEAYFQGKGNLLELIDKSFGHIEISNASSVDTSCHARCDTSRSLPKIALPKFSGKYLDWAPFRDLFSSLVTSNPTLPAVEKLHYLKGHVTDEAAQLIANLALTGDNFQRAWDTLVARYENKRLLVASHLDQLLSLSPQPTRSAEGLKQLIATVKESLGSLRALDVPVEHWERFHRSFRVATVGSHNS